MNPKSCILIGSKQTKKQVEPPSVFIGIIIIGLGLLVESCPNFIVGYDILSAEEKRRTNIRALSTFVRNAFVFTGLALILLFYFFQAFQLYHMAEILIIIVPFVGSIFLVSGSKKFKI